MVTLGSPRRWPGPSRRRGRRAAASTARPGRGPRRRGEPVGHGVVLECVARPVRHTVRLGRRELGGFQAVGRVVGGQLDGPPDLVEGATGCPRPRGTERRRSPRPEVDFGGQRAVAAADDALQGDGDGRNGTVELPGREEEVDLGEEAGGTRGSTPASLGPGRSWASRPATCPYALLPAPSLPGPSSTSILLASSGNRFDHFLGDEARPVGPLASYRPPLLGEGLLHSRAAGDRTGLSPRSMVRTASAR